MASPENKSKGLNFDSIVALASILIALFLIHNEYGMPTPSIPQTLGPSFMPIALLVALILVGIVLFFNSLRQTPDAAGDAAVSPAPVPKTSLDQYKVLGLVTLGLLVYAAILDPIGFIISTALLIIWQAQLFEKGKLMRNLVVGVLFSLLVYYVFVHVLGVMLPAGILAF